MPKAPRTDDADPDKLVRVRAGEYRTADDRFGVSQSTAGWYVVDQQLTNEIGQPLMRGPLPTLDAVRQAIPEARQAKAPAAPKATTRGAPSPGRRTTRRPAPPKPERRTWIDALPAAEGDAVRRLIRTLERAGVPRAEEVVRADRQGMAPAVAAALIERRLAALADDLPKELRGAALDLVMRAAEVLSAEGAAQRAPLPRWALIELPSGKRPQRRITLRP